MGHAQRMVAKMLLTYCLVRQFLAGALLQDPARPANHPDLLKDYIHFPNGWTKARGLEEDSSAVPCSMDDVPPDHHRTKVRLSASAAHMPSADDLSQLLVTRTTS